MSNTITLAAAFRTLGVAADTYGPTINTARSPGDVDVLARALAELTRDSGPEVLVVWNTCDEAVLANAVAFHLGATVSRASEAEGVLTFNEPIGQGAHVVAVATQWSDRRLEVLRRLVSGNGGRLVAVAAVLASDAQAAVTDLTTTALLSEHEAKGRTQ